MTSPKVALLLSYSDIETDPRLRRQIDWLSGAGWIVDTVGLGGHPSTAVRAHHRLDDLKPWVASMVGSVLIYTLLPGAAQFRRVLLDRIPAEVRARVAADEYALIVLNEYEFIPWVGDRSFASSTAHVHLDMHEHRAPRREGTTRWHRLTDRYYRWARHFIGHPRFDSRSTVASGIARLYEDEFALPPFSIIRNAPAFEDQRPTPVDPQRIRLLFHGMASWARGFDEILEAMSLLDDRFTLTFMLAPNRNVIEELRERVRDAGDRIRIVPPSPMREIARRINEYDLEIIFYPSRSTNTVLALPNKIFEAVQGRLGLIIGESPMLREVVETYGNGVVVRGWTGADLARELGALDAAAIDRLKLASEAAARDLNAEHEGRVFLDVVTSSRRVRERR